VPAVVELQRRRDLGGVHVCYFDRSGFVCAHTDEERAAGLRPGDDCDVTRWLVSLDGMPTDGPGYRIVVPHEADQYSESYPVPPFDVEPLPR
jgi:hypothetical protein